MGSPVAVELDERLYRGPGEDPIGFGFRIWGVSDHTSDSGFPAPSPTLPAARLADTLDETSIAEEFDPDTEARLDTFGDAEPETAEAVPRSIRQFLQELNVPQLCSRWNAEDGWDCPRIERASRRSQRRKLGRSLKRETARLESEHRRLASMSEVEQEGFWRRWGNLVDKLDEIKNQHGPNLPLVEMLHKRLLALSVPATDATPTVSASTPKNRRKKKQRRRNKKHSSTKTRLHHRPAFG